MKPDTVNRELALPNSKHFGPACGTRSLSRRLTIFHGNGLGILHFSFSAAFHTIRLHCFTPVF